MAQNCRLHPILYRVEEGETAPELDAMYRQFREKMTGLTFHVADEGTVGNSMVYFAAEQYGFGSAINAAMLEAMQTQCQEGGRAFADYACWLSQGIADAEMGEEETVRAMATEYRGSYEVDHRGYTDHDFMNLITGGFYDYADFQMAVCTSSIDDIEYTYYLAALGDRVVACVQEMSEPNENEELDDEMIAELNEFYALSAELVKGYLYGHYQGRRPGGYPCRHRLPDGGPERAGGLRHGERQIPRQYDNQLSQLFRYNQQL